MPTDRKIIWTGSHDKTLKIYDTNACKLIKSLTGHTAGIWYLQVNPSGNVVCTASPDKTIKMWDINSGKIISDI